MSHIFPLNHQLFIKAIMINIKIVNATPRENPTTKYVCNNVNPGIIIIYIEVTDFPGRVEPLPSLVSSRYARFAPAKAYIV
jgi:hypothetical protein